MEHREEPNLSNADDINITLNHYHAYNYFLTVFTVRRFISTIINSILLEFKINSIEFHQNVKSHHVCIVKLS